MRNNILVPAFTAAALVVYSPHIWKTEYILIK